MLHLEESYRAEAEELMPAWHRWLKDTESTSAASQKVTAEVLSR